MSTCTYVCVRTCVCVCVCVRACTYLQSELGNEFCLLSYSIILLKQPLLDILQLCLCSLNNSDKGTGIYMYTHTYVPVYKKLTTVLHMHVRTPNASCVHP